MQNVICVAAMLSNSCLLAVLQSCLNELLCVPSSGFSARDIDIAIESTC